MSEYVNRFLSLRCSGDVLNATGRLREAEKEITESMAVIQHLKGITLTDKMKYRVFDLCAGNALTSILAVHLLPVKSAIAVDLKKRSGNYGMVSRFFYLQEDIRKLSFDKEDSIIISVHPCKAANIIVDIFNTNKSVKHLIMMPCCNGSYQDVTCYGWLHETKKVSVYDLWTLHLAQNIKDARVRIVTDRKVLSPKRNIIIANRLSAVTTAKHSTTLASRNELSGDDIAAREAVFQK